MIKQITLVLALLSFFVMPSFAAYSYSPIKLCSGDCYITPPLYEIPFQGGGAPGYPANVTNVTNETVVPAAAITGFSLYVTTFLNDATNLILGFLITEEGPEKIIVGRVVFVFILIAIALMSVGTFFGYKKVRKYLVPKK